MASSTSNLPPGAVWFITGCSSGIGAALCISLAKKGFKVAATARKIDSLGYLDDFGAKVLKLSVDVNNQDSVDKALSSTLERFARIDVVVNNAGYGVLGVAEALPELQMRQLMETNFWAAVYLSKKAVSIFRDENPKSGPVGGTVVNVSSMGGRVAFAGDAIYHASKWALEGYTEAISKETHPDWNIRFLLLEPGGTRTNFSSTSMVLGPSHPKYDDPNMTVNQTLKYFADASNLEGWVPADEVIQKLLTVLGREDMPLRLCTGNDAYGAITQGDETRRSEMEKWKELSTA